MSDTLLNNVDLKKYSWFNLGGTAKFFLKPKNSNEFNGKNWRFNENRL